MSSASQLLFGKVQGENFVAPPPEIPDLSVLIIEDSPLLYWKGETNGMSASETDYSGNGFTATAEYTPVAAIRGGASTQAAEFAFNNNDGIQDTTAPVPTLVNETAWTLEAVIQVDSAPSIGSVLGFMMGEWEDYSSGFQIASIYLETPDSGSARSIRTTTYLNGVNHIVSSAYSGTTPAHVMAVRDGASLTLYIDGVQVAQRTDLPASATANSVDGRFNISAPNFPTSYSLNFTGSDFAAYDYALTASRVLDHYNAAGL